MNRPSTLLRFAKTFLILVALTCALAALMYASFVAGAFYPENVFPKFNYLRQSNSSLSPEPLPEKLQNIRRILIIGDSITVLGSRPRGFITLLRDYLTLAYPAQKIEILNGGQRSETSQDMLKRLASEIRTNKPDLLLIFAGTNDVVKSVNPQDYIANVLAMLDQAKKLQLPAMIVSLPLTAESPFYKSSLEFNKVLRKLAVEKQVDFIDVGTPLGLMVNEYRKATGVEDKIMTVDGTHLSAAGQRILANTILTELGVTTSVRNKVISEGGSTDF